MLNMSPVVLEAPPPSPACIVMPGTLRSASVSVVAPCSSSSVRGMTWIVCGVSVSGAAYLVDSTRGFAPLTSTAGRVDADLDDRRRRIGEPVREAGAVEEAVRAPGPPSACR